MRKQVNCQCSFCNEIFLKDESEVKRNLKLERSNYCSLKCAGKVNHKHLEPYFSQNDISIHFENRKDEFTGFREFVRRARDRTKHGESDLTLEYLKDVFEKQNGRCIYSNVELFLPCYYKKNDPLRTASLDRIDSSLGYIQGNVQFISIAMNHMKNSMTHEQTLELIEILKS